MELAAGIEANGKSGLNISSLTYAVFGLDHGSSTYKKAPFPVAFWPKRMGLRSFGGWLLVGVDRLVSEWAPGFGMDDSTGSSRLPIQIPIQQMNPD